MRRYLLLAVILLALSSSLRGAGSIERILHTTVQAYEVSEPTFLDALMTVASDFKVPMGVELVKSPSVLQPVRATWRGATVMEVFTALVHKEKGYGMRVDDGVLHVFSKDAVNSQSNFLNLRLAAFKADQAIAPLAEQRLWQLVNPNVYPRRPAAGGGGIGRSLGARTDERPLSFSLRDTTVRGVLDRLAVSSDHRIWVVTFPPGNALLPSGFRRTVSPTSAKVFPDADEPGWESIR